MDDSIANMFADERYNRQELIPTIGSKGQRVLSNSSVAVIGAGGVKSPILYYLAAAGVGRIRIIDGDSVELSNLNRQILFDMNDIGKPKAITAARRLSAINPDICIEPIVDTVSPQNFDALMLGHTLIFEGGNSAEERLNFNRCAVRSQLTYIHASAQYNYGYVFSVVPKKSPCFQCIFNDLPRSHGGPVPVIGTAVGVAGSVAASEALNILLGRGPKIVDRILFFDGWSCTSIDLPTRRLTSCDACGEPSAMAIKGDSLGLEQKSARLPSHPL